MLRKLSTPKELSADEARQTIIPALLGVVILGLLMLGYGLLSVADRQYKIATILLGVITTLYGSLSLVLRLQLAPKKPLLKWPLELLDAGLVIAGLYYLPPQICFIVYANILLIAIIKSVIWDRVNAYAFILLSFLGITSIIFLTDNPAQLNGIQVIGIGLLGIVVVELVQTLGSINANRIRRLQVINDFVRQISLSLEQEQVLSIVGAAIQKAIEADTYFLGLNSANGRIFFHLLYDDGQFFPPTEVPTEGTLSGWVMRNQRSLFIPDMREDIDLEGVQVILTGNNRNNACWMGVPMRAGSINGIIAVASYTANAFDRTALELLENLAQHAALALDNANHHSEVEAKARLDSLTEVYNHGYIVHIINQEIEKAQGSGTPLSLVMLDIDYFKQYNDNYGHQVGDEVLIRLTQAIRQHIKATDAVGRWGGEEFTIVLPGANGKQAMQVAQRIQETIHTIAIRTHSEKTLPFPTVSQGVAVFPAEATDSDQLIHLADQRLYVAKERGRNQIEPGEAHWERILG